MENNKHIFKKKLKAKTIIIVLFISVGWFWRRMLIPATTVFEI